MIYAENPICNSATNYSLKDLLTFVYKIAFQAMCRSHKWLLLADKQWSLSLEEPEMFLILSTSYDCMCELVRDVRHGCM